MVLALAFCQCPSSTFLTASGLVDGVSAGISFVAGTMISVSARALGSSSLSDFASATKNGGPHRPGHSRTQDVPPVWNRMEANLQD